jgi:hypothetical protein
MTEDMGARKRKPKSPFQPGVMVRVVRPLFVARVGYPMTVHGEAEKLERERQDEIMAFLKSMGVQPDFYGRPLRAVAEITKAIGYELCRQAGWGGRERSIHRREIAGLAGQETEIIRVRFVKTGRYDPGGPSGPDGEYDPPCLLSEETHRLLETRFWAGDYDGVDGRTYLEIEAANVELVKGGE